ncbi:MAG: hypothetical protein ND807_00115 [Vicinamibacterales bacterium]|nr:hypothetical protein [Vicinamibacterales bacterium]
MARSAPAAIGLLLTISATGVAQAPPSLEEVMTSFAAYMSAYAQDYAATIASEHYTQFAGRSRTILDSDFGTVRLPGSPWLGLRDVVRVNGAPVADREARLEELFTNASAAAGLNAQAAVRANRIVDESTRYNIGTVGRTINNPALVLELLDPGRHAAFRFSKDGEDTVAGIRTWRIAFVEQGSPTVISGADDRDLPATGHIWVDPASGRLVRAEVVIRFPFLNRPTKMGLGTVIITFKDVPEFHMWLPDTMIERYDELPGRRLQDGQATYTNYRRFRVESQENVDLPALPR